MKKRTLGCICNHGTTECKDIISLCRTHREYCGVYVCNKGLQDILLLTALNDKMNCHCCTCQAIQFLCWGMEIFAVMLRNDGATKRFFGLLPLNDGDIVGQATPDAFTGLPRKSDDFLAMTDSRNMFEREVA